MTKIALYGAEFFAHHGYYHEERLWGNTFIVDIEASFLPATPAVNDELNNTLNYEQLYNIAETQMRLTRQLLETVAQDIFDQITSQYAYLSTLAVTVSKVNPPLKGRVAQASVTITT